MTRPVEQRSEGAVPRDDTAVALGGTLASRAYAVALSLAVLVLGIGLVLPHLVTLDSSRDAVMAMRMHLEDDWVNLIKDGNGYLDKPHLLFWSAMVGYRLFGVHAWSYRLVSVLVTLLGAWSTFRLGKRLHGDTVGKVAAVMFLTAYATVVGNHDVRMDALLTGFVAFGAWQLVRWLDTGDGRSMALGAAGLGLAFSAKGMIAVAVSGAALLFHVWSRKLWRRLWSRQTALGIAVFALTISPVLYCYHQQFGARGVRFILLGQVLERFAGGKGERHNQDYLFLYHTMVWAFLPWSLLVFTAWLERLRELVRGGWSAFHRREQLTFLGVLVPIAILGFSRYKLAHYLNVFFPLLAIFTASYLDEVVRTARWRWLGVLRNVQKVVIAALLVGLVILDVWAFPVRDGWVIVGAVVLAGLLALAFRIRDRLAAVWVPSAVAISLLSFVQNANYQPWVGRYQFGEGAASELLAEDIDWAHTYFLEMVSHPIQFYTRRVIPRVDLAKVQGELLARDRVFLLVGEDGRAAVEGAGLVHRVRRRFDDCRVLKMTPSVLNPRTRDQACRPVYLLEVGRYGSS